MRVAIRQRFEGASLHEVEQLYMLDDDFNRATFADMGYGRKVVSCLQRGSLLDRTLHLCPLTGLPEPFASLVPRSVFFITERVQYDFAQHTGTWRTEPSVLSKQFRAEGTLAIATEGDGVLFTLEGEARASIPLLSSRAERQAVSTAESQHEALARAVRKRLDLSRPVTSYEVISA